MTQSHSAWYLVHTDAVDRPGDVAAIIRPIAFSCKLQQRLLHCGAGVIDVPVEVGSRLVTAKGCRLTGRAVKLGSAHGDAHCH